MAGKYEKKKKKKSKGNGKAPKRTGKWLLAAVLLVVCALALAWFLRGNEQLQQNQQPPAATTEEVAADNDFREIDLGQGLRLERIGAYTGMYVEDGSNDLVSGVMMAVVTNASDKDLEYAQITVRSENEEALFTVTALPSGKTAVLLEKSRKEYSAEAGYDRATMDAAAFFQEPLSNMEDTFAIQGLDGALNVTNISEEDIVGDIVICYKNTDANYLYGGIAYRVKIEGGLKAGEIRQIMTEHFAGEGSAIVYVNVVEAA